MSSFSSAKKALIAASAPVASAAESISSPTATLINKTSSLVSPELQAWRDRIRSVQHSASQASHSEAQRAREVQEQSARAYKSARQARRLERSNMLNMQCSSLALNAFASAPARASSSAYKMVSDRLAKFSGAIQQSARSSASYSAPSAGELLHEEEVDDADLNALESEVREYAIEQTTAMPNAQPAAPSLFQGFGFAALDTSSRLQTAQAVGSELADLLRQLEREPSDEAECNAKFRLFEDFLATVTTIREQTLAFWAENKDQFTGSSRTAGDRAIRDIDSSSAMGIEDDPRRWFVYLMAIKANENSTAISAVLASLRSRLEQLANELGECPFCLDPMSADTCTLLACAHRACNSCWMHWQQLKGPEAAFCPICRHAEFVEEILL